MLSKAFPSLCPARLHHPVLAASPKALAVLPATAGWFVLPHLGPTWHLQLLGEALPPHQAWGRCHPALKSESKRLAVTPAGHPALQAGWGMHMEQDNPNVQMPACCHCHREGERLGEAEENCWGRGNKSFLLPEWGSCSPGDREEVAFAAARIVLDIAGKLWITRLETARLFLFSQSLFSWPQSSPSS